MQLTSTFGERIKELIFEKGITPNDLSQELSIDLSLIYKWQRNVSIPTLENLLRLSEYFKVTIDFIAARIEYNYYSTFKSLTPFHIRLKQIIELSGISSFDFCKKYKFNFSTIQHWLKNERQPLLDSLLKLADALNLTLDYLVGID